MHQNLGKIVCKFSPFMHKEFIPGLGVSQNKEMVFFKFFLQSSCKCCKHTDLF